MAPGTHAGHLSAPPAQGGLETPLVYSRPPLPVENTLPDPQGRPETADGTKPYIYYVFPTHTYNKASFIN